MPDDFVTGAMNAQPPHPVPKHPATDSKGNVAASS